MTAIMGVDRPQDEVLAHVGAYAAAVRGHLRDLPPELVDDLTDGLEADLVEALEDTGPGAASSGWRAVAPDGVPVPGAPAGAALHDPRGRLDLTRRFGPAHAYAAELRAAAGLAPAHLVPRPPARPVRDAAHGLAETLRRRAAAAAAPLTSAPWWPSVADVALALRPVWWALRGWVWFVVLSALAGGVLWVKVGQVLVPESVGGLLLLLALVVLSTQWGRGRVRGPRVARGLLRLGHVVAVVAVLPMLGALAGAMNPPTETVYVDVPGEVAAPAAPTDGVYVDGQQVSNLFVYDADGRLVDGAQVFDDRGREVRVLAEGGPSEWYLPGVADPWVFAPGTDAQGRERWNVYPLRGAPSPEWTFDDAVGELRLPDGVEAGLPPLPFAQAPRLGAPYAPTTPEPAADDAATTDPAQDAAADPATTDPAAPDPTTSDPATTDPATTDPATTTPVG